MSDSKLVQIAFIDAASYLPPPFLPPLVSFCRQKKNIMLLLHLLLSFSFYSNPGPRTTRPSCHFLGLYENASSFSKQKKKLICVSLRSRIRISHIPKWKQKARPLPQKKSTQHNVYCYTGGWGEADPGCEPLVSVVAGRFFAHSDLHRSRNIINM